jgi:hypothetical protein
MEREPELWIARHDYSKEKEDVLSFDKGARFKVMSKSNAEWWAVKNVDTDEVGYVPASYLEAVEQTIEACELKEDAEQPGPDVQPLPNKLDIREKIMQVAQRKEPPTGKAVTEPDEDEVIQITPKKVPHPTSSSTSHKKLHKELQLSNKLGGVKQLGMPELQKVMDRRRPDSEGRPGTITGKPRKGDNLGDKELSSRLRQQSEKLTTVSFLLMQLIQWFRKLNHG